MGFNVNLLHHLSQDRAWTEVVLDLDPQRFEREHVRALKRGAAKYLGLEPSAVRVLGIARWKPILVLELPADGARRLAGAFETSEPSLLEALKPLALRSLRLDSPTDPPAGVDGIPVVEPAAVEDPPESFPAFPWRDHFEAASLVVLGVAGSVALVMRSILVGIRTLVNAFAQGLGWILGGLARALYLGRYWIVGAACLVALVSSLVSSLPEGTKAPPPEARAPTDDADARSLARGSLPARESNVVSVAFSADHADLLVADRSGRTFVWPVAGNKRTYAREFRLPCRETGFVHDWASLAWSHDRQRLATVHHDGTLRVHCPGELPTELRLPDYGARRTDRQEVTRAAWSPDGSRLLTLSKDGTARIWWIFARPGRDAVASPDASRFAFAVGSRRKLDGHTEVWQADGTKKLWSVPGVKPSFSPTGSRLLTLTVAGIRIWDSEGRPVRTLGVEGLGFDPRLATFARFSPDGAHVAVLMRYHGDAYVLTTDGTEEPVVLPPLEPGGHPEVDAGVAITDLVWSGGGRRLAAISEGLVRIWEVGSWNRPWVLPKLGHHLSWNVDGSRFFTYGTAHDNDGLRVWAGDGRGEPVHLVADWVQSAAWSPDGTTIAVAYPTYSLHGTSRREIHLWPVGGGEPLALPPWPETGYPIRVGFSADGSRVLGYGLSGPPGEATSDVRIWHADGSSEVDVLPRHTRSLQDASISPDGRWVLTEDHRQGAEWVHLWRASGPLDLPTPDLGTGDFVAEDAAWSPNGAFVAAVTREGDVLVWPADGGGEPIEVGDDSSSRAPVWSPDGGRLLVFSVNSTFRVHLVFIKGNPVVFEGHESEVTGAAWSSDGRHVLSTSLDRTARVWSSATGKQVAVFRGHRSEVLAGAWSGDGRIATVAADRSVRLWAAP